MASFDVEVTEALRVGLLDGPTRAQTGVVVEGMTLGEVVTGSFGLLVTERLRVLEQLTPNSITLAGLIDAVRFADKLRFASDATLVDVVGVGLSIETQTAFQLIERLKLSSALQGSGIYRLSLVQALRLTVSLGNFFGADIVEELGLETDLVARALARITLTENVGIEAVVTPQLLVQARLEDGIEIEPEQLLRMLFSPTLVEGVEFTAGWLEPDGSLTTWVMNTRSGAVTEYQDYGFNSFARMGGRYLGASEKGLFELLGDDDDGEDIVARIRGGYLQFGGTQLSRLKEAYIAARGEGRWVLRVLTGDGATYNYEVDNRSMRSTKFHMGKGQRARYFAYELVSAGQDFDLDTLEFVPIVVQRRV